MIAVHEANGSGLRGFAGFFSDFGNRGLEHLKLRIGGAD
jgi:hypothetical protein